MAGILELVQMQSEMSSEIPNEMRNEMPSEMPNEMPNETPSETPYNSFHSTIRNEDGVELLLRSYSTSSDTKSKKRIVINDIDMSFEEFRGYLSSAGMPDEHEVYEARRMDELKTVVIVTSIITAFGLLSFAIWASTLLESVLQLECIV